MSDYCRSFLLMVGGKILPDTFNAHPIQHSVVTISKAYGSQRALILSAFALCVIASSGCNKGQRQDAKTISQSGYQSSTQLADFYKQLSEESEADAEFGLVNTTLYGTSDPTSEGVKANFDASEKIGKRFRQRQKMATDLKEAFGAFNTLSDYNAAKETREKATKLYDTIQTVEAFDDNDTGKEPLGIISSALGRMLQEREIKKTLPEAIKVLNGVEYLVENERAHYTQISRTYEANRATFLKNVIIGPPIPTNPSIQQDPLGKISLGWDVYLEPYNTAVDPELLNASLAKVQEYLKNKLIQIEKNPLLTPEQKRAEKKQAYSEANSNKLKTYINNRNERLIKGAIKAKAQQARQIVESYYALSVKAREFLDIQEKHPLILVADLKNATIIADDVRKPEGVPADKLFGTDDQDKRKPIARLIYTRLEPSFRKSLDSWPEGKPLSGSMAGNVRKTLNGILESHTFTEEEINQMGLNLSNKIKNMWSKSDPDKMAAGLREVLLNRKIIESAYPGAVQPLSKTWNDLTKNGVSKVDQK